MASSSENAQANSKTHKPKAGQRVVWITGSSSGIGAALAKRMARHNWAVAVTARSEDKLKELEKEAADMTGSIHAFPGDITKPEKMTQCVKKIEDKLGPLNMAVLNAGTYKPDTAENFTAENFRHHTEINLNGTANCIEPLIKTMTERKSGHIAIVASVAGYRGLPRSLSYGPTKAALINMAEALAIETMDKGIKVQVINPGFVETPLTEQNKFEMPFIMTPEDAAEQIEDGLYSNKFSIDFPWQMVSMLSTAGKLPAPLYFKAVKKATAAQTNNS